MKALILLDNAASTNNNYPGHTYTRYAENACWSMGIKVYYYKVTAAGTPSAAQLAEHIAAIGADIVVIPATTGNNRAYWSVYTNAVATLGVPVFCLLTNDANSTYTRGVASTSAFYPGDTTSTAALATISRTDGEIMSYARRVLLSSSLVAPESVKALITGQGADTTAVSAWRWTPNGTDYVYYHNNTANTNLLHFLIQEAVEDGALSAPPVRAPIFLTLDHINGNGESGVYTAGSQGQPSIISNIGDILRNAGAVCYVSVEEGDSAGHSAEQIALLQEYANQFRFIASHDHTAEYTSGTATDSAIDSQATKADIDASYQATAAVIEGMGLTVSPELLTFATNRVGPRLYELAQVDSSYLADPTETAAQAGYGCKFARLGSGDSANAFSYPSLSSNGKHWMNCRTSYRGIILSAGSDAGVQTRSASVDDSVADYKAFRVNLDHLCIATLTYFHVYDFEDPSLNQDGLISNGSASARGLTSYRMGAAYAAACRDTICWGADINNYR